jgi:hypothetical protein
MARARSIKPAFFKNEFLAECEPMARLLFVGLWTLADRNGRLEYRPLRIKAELFPYENCDMAAMLKQLEDRGFVRAYEVQGVRVLEIPKFCDHQRCHPDERAEQLPPCEDGQAGLSGAPAGKFTGSSESAAHEPGNFPSNCASYPSSFNPSTSSPSVATSEPPKRRTRSRPDAAISWTADAGWQGITEADRQEWRLAYPACDLAGELARATSWLRANPTKAHKSNWRKFVVGWLTRSQDRGGTNRTPGVRPDEKPPPKAFAGRDAERFAATLAKAVTLTEEDLR